MLVNPSTNVSGSKADYGVPFLEGTPEINLRFGARLHNLRVQRELSQEELAQVPGINRRVLGRNLTRLCDAGRIAKTADGRYTLQPVSQ